MSWMHDMDAHRGEMREMFRADLAEVRQEMHAGFANTRAEVRQEVRALREEVRAGFATLEIRFERRFGDLIKWSFVFWCGAVGAVALLAKALG